MKRSTRFAVMSTLLLAGASAKAGEFELPNYNAYEDARVVSPKHLSPSQTQGVKVAGITGRDAKRDVPTFFWAPKNGPVAPMAGTGKPEDSARFYLETYAQLYNAGRSAVSAAKPRVVNDTGRGGIVVVFRQVVGGVELLNNDVKVVMTRKHELVSISGSLHNAVSPGTKRGNTWKIAPQAAISRAVNDFFNIHSTAADFITTTQVKDNYNYFDFAGTPESVAANLTLEQSTRVKKVWFPMPDRIVAAYYLELWGKHTTSGEAALYSYIIGAADGKLLARQRLTDDVAFTYRVWASPTAPYDIQDGPLADYQPHPTGMADGSRPMPTPSSLVTVDGFNRNPMGTFDSWLANNANRTDGNNVIAYADWAGSNQPTGGTNFYGTTTSANTFDFTYDLSLAPDSSQNQAKAAVVQLFFLNNWMHDYFYDSGFNEAAGNAQQNNYGRGGAQGDPIRAEGQDTKGTNRNNANMSTPADGTSPRMQMYIFDGPSTAALTLNPGGGVGQVGVAGWGPATFNIGPADVALIDDGSTTPTGTATTGTVTDACQPILTNLTGKIALIDRGGGCAFTVKVLNAQAQGAIGVIIANNTPYGTPPSPMGGTPAMPVNIGVQGVTLAVGDQMKAALMMGTLQATMVRGANEISRDGTIDNGISGHEWGHYIHHRLTDPNTQQGGSQGEGWGDFMGIMQGVRAGDNVEAVFATGVYASAAFGDSGYFGIRRFPYSRDKTKNPLTFKHISDGEPIPTGIPIQPAAANNSEVHNAGEVWCQMMWQGYSEMLKNGVYGANPRYMNFAQAKRAMADYVVAGMQAAPVGPTFTEQRDGILAAADAANPSDFADFARGFANRGAGVCAVSPPRASTDLVGVVESYDSGATATITDVSFAMVTECDNDGVLDGAELGRYTVTIANDGWADLTNASLTISSTNPDISFPNGATQMVAAVARNATATVTFDVAMGTNVMGIQDLGLSIALTAAGACTSTPNVAIGGRGNYDEVAMSTATESFESSGPSLWTATNATGPSTEWALAADPTNAANTVAHGNDSEPVHDERWTSPDLIVGATGLTMTFKHRHKFEASDDGTGNIAYWDGGVIEVSQNNGVTWQDISMFGTPGYNQTLGYPMGTNPLNGRQGYADRNPSYPAYDTVTIDTGMALANRTIKVRFRIGTDDFVGDEGWDVDDVGFTGLTNTPFTGYIPDTTKCPPNTPAAASAGMDINACAGDVVTLDATGTTDVDNDPLTFLWSQSAGPMVSLATPMASTTTFTAPAVMMPTTFTFQITVNDGSVDSTDTVNVIVSDCNLAPIANAGPDQVVFSGDNVTLNASGSSDPNNDPLTFAWSQSVGPMVTLSAPMAVTTNFIAPVVMMPTTLTFAVNVSDGALNATDTVDVLVNPIGGTGGMGGGGMGGGGMGGGGMGGGGMGGMGGGGMGGMGGGGMGGMGGAMSSSSSSSSTSSSSTSSSSTSSSSGVAGMGGEGGSAEEGPIVGGGGCDCSIPGNEAPGQTRDVGGSILALLGAWLIRRRRQNKAS